MGPKDSLIPHILLPLPNLQEIQRPSSRAEILDTIIRNLEKQQNAVKLNIIEAAERQKEVSAVEQGVDAVAVDTPRGRARPSHDAAMQQMLASLNTPYKESMGDPYLRPDAMIPSPPPGTRQATPPPEIQRAKETLDKIELYEKHAARTRTFYKRALEQERRRTSLAGSRSAGPGNAGRKSSVSIAGVRSNAIPDQDPRRSIQSRTVSSSSYDASRDPRANRQGGR